MLRRLTTPKKPTSDLPDVLAQFVGRTVIELALVDNGKGDGGSADESKAAITLELNEVGPDGTFLSAKRYVLFASDWSSALRQAIKTVRGETQAHLQSIGVLAPGTDEEIIK